MGSPRVNSGFTCQAVSTLHGCSPLPRCGGDLPASLWPHCGSLVLLRAGGAPCPGQPPSATMSTSSLRRQMKNIVHNYSEAEIKVREATSNDPWGPSSSLMSEIADLTYNVVAFSEIMSMIWKRLNDHGKNWRHVYKVGVGRAGPSIQSLQPGRGTHSDGLRSLGAYLHSQCRPCGSCAHVCV